MKKKEIISNSGTLLVNRKVETVFEFFSNPENDKFWRKEINQSTLVKPLQVGTMVAEYSYLSKKAPCHLTELRCVQYEKNKMAVFETMPEAKFYLKSQRLVSAVSENTTQIFYKIEFEGELVKFALGFSLPAIIIRLKSNRDLKKYLGNLKTKLEES